MTNTTVAERACDLTIADMTKACIALAAAIDQQKRSPAHQTEHEQGLLGELQRRCLHYGLLAQSGKIPDNDTLESLATAFDLLSKEVRELRLTEGPAWYMALLRARGYAGLIAHIIAAGRWRSQPPVGMLPRRG